MKKILFILIFIFFGFIKAEIFAEEVVCPVFKEPLVSGNELISKIEQCQNARIKNNPASITDFNCPSGDFSLQDGKEFTNERLAYHISVNILMNEADKEINKFFKILQNQRSKDSVSWAKTITSCVDGSADNLASVTAIYQKICSFGYIENLLNSNDKKIISHTDAYPQEICNNFANKKIKAWKNLGNSLAILGVNKSYQNDKDSFLDKININYRGLLEKFHDYQKIIFRSSAKIGPYTRNPVQ